METVSSVEILGKQISDAKISIKHSLALNFAMLFVADVKRTRG